jgi:hypothetical protein
MRVLLHLPGIHLSLSSRPEIPIFRPGLTLFAPASPKFIFVLNNRTYYIHHAGKDRGIRSDATFPDFFEIFNSPQRNRELLLSAIWATREFCHPIETTKARRNFPGPGFT